MHFSDGKTIVSSINDLQRSCKTDPILRYIFDLEQNTFVGTYHRRFNITEHDFPAIFGRCEAIFKNNRMESKILCPIDDYGGPNIVQRRNNPLVFRKCLEVPSNLLFDNHYHFHNSYFVFLYENQS